MSVHHITNSGGISLRFPTTADYLEHKAKEDQLLMDTYKKLRSKYGIWAGNQNKYVTNIEEFNSMDSTYEEELLAKELESDD